MTSAGENQDIILRAQNGRLQRAIKGSSDGLWEWVLLSDEVWYDSRFIELLEFTREEFPGVLESWSSRLHPDDYQPTWDAVERHLQSGEPYDVECRLLTKSGTYRWFRARGTAYHDEAGQPLCMAGSIQSIDDLKHTIYLLEEKEAQLLHQQKLDAVGSLAGGIAHEFNNLLQAIRGYTTFAKEELDENSQPYQDLEKVLTASERATLLTRQLLDFSRTESAEAKHCYADEIARDLASLLRPVLPETINFELRLAAPTAIVLVDPHLTAHALLNLCINARDAMPDGGELLVRSEVVTITEATAQGLAPIEAGRYLRFLVTDTGTGIPADVQEHIYEPFFTTKEVGKGTGLGLPVVFGVAQRAGGMIRLHSETGRGTTFSIYLPNCEEETMVEKQQPFPSGNGATVLLAEDDALVRDVGQRMLQRAGYRVIEACDGQEALDLYKAQAGQIDLMILDVVMPRLNGREVFEEVRRLDSYLPICFCTGYDPEAAQSDSLRSMGYQVVEKPFLEDRFLTTVNEVLHAAHAAVSTVH